MASLGYDEVYIIYSGEAHGNINYLSHHRQMIAEYPQLIGFWETRR